MKILIGLGNPGTEYTHTRHNFGFRVIDRASSAWNVALEKDGHCRAMVGRCDRFEKPVLLVKPHTFMNASGVAVRQLLERHAIEPKDLLVVFDDVSFPLGTFRIRTHGGGGGHNGLISIIEALETEAFPRMRLGISTGPVASQDLTGFVLGEFSPSEEDAVGDVLPEVVGALELLMTKGIAEAMNVYNGLEKGEK